MPTDMPPEDHLARSLAWFSLGLGAVQAALPGPFNRLIGIRSTRRSRMTTRLMCAPRELGAGAMLLTRPNTAGPLWARVGGDACDLTLLSVAAVMPRNRRLRITAAITGVVAITAADVVLAFAMSRKNRQLDKEGLLHAESTITVRRPPEEVYEYWHDFERLPAFMYHVKSVSNTGPRRTHWVVNGPADTVVEWDAETVEDTEGQRIRWRSLDNGSVSNSGEVTFTPAPGERGTEVTVDLEFRPPAGQIGTVVAKLFGEDPQQQVRDDLRRFKQVVETGDVVRSDGTPDGAHVQAAVLQRSAQPREIG